MKNQLDNDFLKKSDYYLNQDRFKAVFFPKVWEKENTPMKTLNLEESKKMIDFLRERSKAQDQKINQLQNKY